MPKKARKKASRAPSRDASKSSRATKRPSAATGIATDERIADALEAIVAQRLVRTVCSRCKEQYTPTEEQLMELGITPEEVVGRKFFRGKGCDNCHGSGYKGRTALFEIMQMDDGLRDLIMNEASLGVLRDEARRRGMRSLRESGLLAIYEGRTSIDEVVRETVLEE